MKEPPRFEHTFADYDEAQGARVTVEVPVGDQRRVFTVIVGDECEHFDLGDLIGQRNTLVIYSSGVVDGELACWGTDGSYDSGDEQPVLLTRSARASTFVVVGSTS